MKSMHLHFHFVHGNFSYHFIWDSRTKLWCDKHAIGSRKTYNLRWMLSALWLSTRVCSRRSLLVKFWLCPLKVVLALCFFDTNQWSQLWRESLCMRRHIIKHIFRLSVLCYFRFVSVSFQIKVQQATRVMTSGRTSIATCSMPNKTKVQHPNLIVWI